MDRRTCLVTWLVVGAVLLTACQASSPPAVRPASTSAAAPIAVSPVDPTRADLPEVPATETPFITLIPAPTTTLVQANPVAAAAKPAAAPAEDVPSSANVEGSRPDVEQQLGSSGIPVRPTFDLLTDNCPRLIAGHTQPLSEAEYMIPAMLYFCLEGFQPGQVSIRLMRPDGTVRSASLHSVPDALTSQFSLLIPLIDPPGRYSLTVAQGNLMATGTFDLREATEPRIIIFPPGAPSETAFTVYLAGFASKSRVILDEYLAPGPFVFTLGPRYDYSRSFSVDTDAKGQAAAKVILSGHAGQHLLRADNGSASYFRLTQTGGCASTMTPELKVCVYSP